MKYSHIKLLCCLLVSPDVFPISAAIVCGHCHIRFPKIWNDISFSVPGSSVGIATDYGLDGPDRIPVGTRFSARPDRPWGLPSLLYNGYRIFPGSRDGRGVGLSPHPNLVPKVLEKSTAIPLLTLRVSVAYKNGENLPTFPLQPFCVCHCLMTLVVCRPLSRNHVYS